MSSFIINCILMLTSSFGMISYFANNFESWLRETACERMFKVMIGNTKYIKYLYQLNVFSYSLVVFFFFVTGYLLTQPSKKSKIAAIMRKKKSERMKAMKKQED